MTNKEFAEENAGKYFAFKCYKVRVVGYCKENEYTIIVSAPARMRDLSWSKEAMDEDDILVIPSKASRFWYVSESELKRWK